MKVGVIGSGGIARRHLAILRDEPDIEIVGHVTAHQATAEAAAREWGGQAYLEYSALLDRAQPDAVWICVPPQVHGALELELANRGISMFVEKPLSTDVATAEQIGQALAGADSIAAVGYHWRALDTLPDVWQAIAGNPVKMALGFWLNSTPPPAWWHHQAKSGGQLVEQATHIVDLARVLLGEGTPVAGAAVAHFRPSYPDLDVADVSAGLVRFSNAIGVFAATCALAHQESVELQLICEGLFISITQQRVTFQQGEERWEARATADPFRVENRAFLDALRQRDASRVLCSYQDALASHRLCCSLASPGNADEDTP